MKAVGTCLRVSIAVIKYHDQKQLEKERISFILQFSDHTPSLRKVRTGTQGRKLVTGTSAEAIEECCLLTCCPWFAQPAFLYHLTLPAQM